MTLRELLPDEDYRFSMKFQRGPIEEFFAPTPRHDEVLAERRRWLTESPERHAALLPEGVPLLVSFARLAGPWVPGSTLPKQESPAFLDPLLDLGQNLEPDFLLLKKKSDEKFHLLGACICFPSSWSLAEKMGRPIEFIHDTVPGLNAALGKPIHHFLDRLQPGPAWLRANWGLSRAPDLNQHPDRQLPRLDASVRADEVWLRVEHQALTALPEGDGVLFGIRIAVHPLAEVQRDAAAAAGLHRALRTMPEDVARYKGVVSARDPILRWLSEDGASVRS